MHSRIIELKLNKDDENELDVKRLPEWFYNYADYAIESDDSAKDIEWFMDYLYKNGINCNTTDTSITLDMKSPLAFFKNRFYKWKECIEKIDDITLEQFANVAHITKHTKDGKEIEKDFTCSTLIYDIKTNYNDESEFWIYFNCELYTISNFMRALEYILVNKESTTFYFGNTLDYHF